MPKIECKRLVIGPAGAKPLRTVVQLARGAEGNLCRTHGDVISLIRSAGAAPTRFAFEDFCSLKIVWYPLAPDAPDAALACHVRKGRVERVDLMIAYQGATSTAAVLERLDAGFGISLPPQVAALSAAPGSVLLATLLYGREAVEFADEGTDLLAFFVLVPAFCEVLEID